MLLRDVLSISFKSIVRNKRRAALTMLGIIIGVSSVILMLEVGQAAERFILSQVASFGSDLLFIRNGPGDGRQGAGPPVTTIKESLTFKDYKKIKQMSWVTSAGANIYQDLLIEYQGEGKRRRVAGTSESEIVIYNTEIGRGEFYGQDDVDSAARVAVLGADIAEELFGEEDPIGKTVKVQKQNYRVIGIMKPAGTRFFTNLDKQVYVPVTALMRQLNKDYLMYINAKIGTVPVEEAKERIRLALRDAHNLDNPSGDLAKDDFFIASQEDATERAGVIGDILQILLSSIAAISLIVGGVGIMNIMYVTVTERTREIGLRKAIGAQYRDILRQFLFEAVILTIVAGVIGVLVGLALSYLGILALQAYQDGWAFSFPYEGIALGFTVSATIGIVFGYFPARKAAKLKPIEALRYE
jgi:putative ABC transport system permease protein